MKNIIPFLLLGTLLSVLTFTSCRHEPVLSEDSATVCFQDQVLPLIRSNCAIPGCHDGGSDGEEALTNYENISNFITPGKPNDSKIYKLITTTSIIREFMPPSPRNPLTQKQIDLISIWILQGAENNSCLLLPCDTIEVNYSTDIYPVIETYCKGCHSGGNPSGGVRLEIYEQIAASGLNGSLYGSVSFSSGFIPMPYQGNMLPNCYITMIKNWVENGVPNN